MSCIFCRTARRIRYRLAHYLDRKPHYCWANLVMWAEGYRSFWSLFIKDHDENDYTRQVCLRPEEPYAYCGKCRERRIAAGLPDIGTKEAA